MINKIVLDGNDGTGKTTRVEILRKLFPNIAVEDRGIFSKETLNDKIFVDYENKKYLSKNILNFYNVIKNLSDTLFIILKADSKICQERILKRGDSIDEEFHNMIDLKKYNYRFDILCDIVKDLPNVMIVKTD